jgi:microcystin-dependent protein
MAQPFIGEIRMFCGNFAPVNWAFCNGAAVAINENEALFQLIGTTYGGDGQNTFALPNLQSRIPIHQGTDSTGMTYVIGAVGGAETVTLTPAQMPIHTHVPQAATGAAGTSSDSPQNNYWSGWTGGQFSNQPVSANMSGTAIGPAGSSQPHDNMPPFLVINFIIALYGIFPSQS